VYHYPLTYYFSDTFSGEATNGLSNTFLNEATGNHKKRRILSPEWVTDIGRDNAFILINLKDKNLL